MQVISAHGHGPPLLLLHGSPSSPRGFEPLARALSERRRVFIGELPCDTFPPRMRYWL